MVSEAKLQSYFAHHLSAVRDLRVTGLRTMPHGFSYDTYGFTVTGWQGSQGFSHKFVLRMEPEVGPVPPYDASREFTVLKALQDTPVPVPRVHWLELDPSVMGRPFYVMDWVEGEVPSPDPVVGRVIRPDDPERHAMAREFVRVLAALHTLDWRGRGLEVLGVPQDNTEFTRREIERWEKLMDFYHSLPHPVFTPALAWLRSHIPPAERTTLVHGDFRLGNFIWNEGKIAAFLDWEMADLGDPMSDVGWVFLRRMRGRSPLLCRLIEPDYFLQRYEELTGFKVREEALRFWEVWSTLKLGAIFVAGTNYQVSGIKQEIQMSFEQFGLPRLVQELADMLASAGA